MPTVPGNVGEFECGGIEMTGCILSPFFLTEEKQFLHEVSLSADIE